MTRSNKDWIITWALNKPYRLAPLLLEGYVINLGTRHGIQVGDHFTLNKVASKMLDRNFSSIFIRNVANSQMQVIATNEETSLIASPDINNSISARLFDLLSPAKH